MSVTAAKSIDSNKAEAERELTDGFNLMIDALKLNGLDHDLRRARASRSRISAAWRRPRAFA